MTTSTDALPTGEAKVAAVRSMFDTIAPRYDLVNRIMTFRLDVAWRRRSVAALRLAPGAVVADLACGTGDFCVELAAAGLDPVGIDLSLGMLHAARTTVPLVQADGLALPLADASVHGVTCGFALRNVVDLAAFLVEVGRVVRPGGRISLLEVSAPEHPLLRLGHGIYFGRVVPLIGGLLSDPAAYRYLPKSVAYLPEPADLLALVEGAGFVNADRRLLSGGIAQLLTATRPKAAWGVGVTAGVGTPAGAEPVPPVAVADLAAVTVAVGAEAWPAPDGTVFDGPGFGFSGQGVALRVPVDRTSPERAAQQVAQVLGAISSHDEVRQPGTGPVAIGALPFDPTDPLRPHELLVPARLYGRAPDGTRWCTTIGPPGTGLDDGAAPAGPSRPEPSTFTVAADRPTATWRRSVAALRDDLRSGAARKAVLARAVTVEADAPLDRRAILERLATTYPGCMRFAVDDFVGATPELLVARFGDAVHCHPMAGTAARSADAERDAALAAALAASSKDRVEHRITIDMVHETLLPWCSYLDEEAEPSIVAMANVQHLATRMEGRLSAPPASALQLALALHPTPAVGGYPRAEALELIGRHEALDRGRYAGPVGWVDARGDGQWAVGIRSAQLDGPRARLYAGVGVVADSDPDAELAETRAKLQALLSAIIQP